jgi:hypothetical protein
MKGEETPLAFDLPGKFSESCFYSAVKKGNYAELGFPGFPDQYGSYPMSKIAVTALTRIQQRLFDQERPDADIIVNAVGFFSKTLFLRKIPFSVLSFRFPN